MQPHCRQVMRMSMLARSTCPSKGRKPIQNHQQYFSSHGINANSLRRQRSKSITQRNATKVSGPVSSHENELKSCGKRRSLLSSSSGRRGSAIHSFSNAQIMTSADILDSSTSQPSNIDNSDGDIINRKQDCSTGISYETLAQKKTLVLDVAYRPISVVNWKRAIVMEMLAKAEVLEYYEDIGIHSVNDVFPLPAVMKVCFYVKNMNERKSDSNSKAMVNRKSILIRDKYECQYCGSKSNLTIDHVIPVSKGGEWRYDNLVTACSRCNTKKAAKLPHECRMHPRRKPDIPKFFSVGIVSCIAETVIAGKAFPIEWTNYMPKEEKFS